MTIVTRRTLLAAAAVNVAVAATSAMPVVAARPKQAPVSVEAWMDRWMKERGPEGKLHVGRFKDPMYFLLEPIGWKPDGDQIGKYPDVEVPKGFVTDFASIPRVFWSLLPPDGEYTYPAIIHDYLYWKQGTTRDVADEILRIGMQNFKIDSITVEAIYRGVRVGGGGPWAANAKERRQGIKRVLIKEPDDPTTTWAVWRRRADVFGPE